MSYSYGSSSSSSTNTNTTSTSGTSSNTNTTSTSGTSSNTNTTSTSTSGSSYDNDSGTTTSTTTSTTSNNPTTFASSVVVPSTSTVKDESLLPDDASVGDRVTIDSRVYEFSSGGWVVISEGNFLRFPSNPDMMDRYSIANKTWEYDGNKWSLVYVGAVEDQDDYVKKVAVQHNEYFADPDNQVIPTPHDLYGKEIDDMLNMLNNGPSVYTAGNGISVVTGRDMMISDSGGIVGNNFQAVHINVDLRSLTSVAEIDIKDINITGLTVVDLGVQATYAALLTGRPTNVAYNWIITEQIGDAFVPTSSLKASFVGPSNRSYVEILIRETGTYRLEVKALVKRTNNEGIIVIDSELDTNIEVAAQEILPLYDDVPNAQVVTCFLNPQRAETNGGYVFYKRDVVFKDESGNPSTVPIINFSNSSIIGNGLHFVFTGLEDAQPMPESPTAYEGYVFVHEDLMEDRLKWSTKAHTTTNVPFSLGDVSTLLIGPTVSNGSIDYGLMRASSFLANDTDAYPPYYGISAYNYRGYAIVDPFPNVDASVKQAVNMSVNSKSMPPQPDEVKDQFLDIQYIDNRSTSVTPDITEDITYAVSMQNNTETKILEMGNSIPNGVLPDRFTRGYIQPTKEIRVLTDVNGQTQQVAVVRNHFIKDKDSKYFVCNARAEKPTTFLQIYMYDLWIEQDFSFALAGMQKFSENDEIDPRYLNYYPTNPVPVP